MVKNSLDHGTHTEVQNAWSQPCVGSGHGSHRVLVVGYLQGPRPDGLDCDRPLLVVCGNCAARTVWRCKNHRESRCRSCSNRYRLRVRRIASDGMLSRCRTGHQGMLTVTAPSSGGHLGWVVDWNHKEPRPVCSCDQKMAGGLGVWNASAGKRWNRLRGDLARLYPGLVYLRVVEIQERGAIHLHILVWTPKPLVLNEVQTLAMLAGFGCVIDYEESVGTGHAHYVSKYATKSTDQRQEVPWEQDRLDRSTGEVRAVTDAKYRNWSCSRDWGLTMKAVEAAIREAAQKRAAEVAESPTLATELGEHAGTGSPVIAGEPPP